MKKNNRGFTLTELVVVIGIIGVLISIATISMAGYVKRTKLRTALYEIDGDVRQSRWIAKSRGTECYLQFDPATSSYTLNGVDRHILPAGVRFGIDPSVIGCPGEPSRRPPLDGITFGTSRHPNTLIYYPTGDIVPAGTIYITDGRQTMAVRVARLGRPKLWRSEGGVWSAM